MPETDRTLACGECGKEYVLTADEREYLTRQEDASGPTLCWSCRELRKIERGTKEGYRRNHRRKNGAEPK